MSPAQTPPPASTDPAGPRRAGLVALASIAAGVSFCALVWLRRGAEPAQQYLAGYLVELSLSVDNVFVFALVFEHFHIEPARQRRLLLLGILGAIVLRTAVLAAGLGAIARFAWVVPVVGVLILWSGARLGLSRSGRARMDPERQPLLRWVEKRAPQALAALLVLETADLVFALDSLPAVMAITHDLSIAVASNLFALLGLRSLFTVVSGALRRLRHLHLGLAVILALVGLKMIAEPWYRVPTWASLAAIAAVLGLCTLASLRPPPQSDEGGRSR